MRNRVLLAVLLVVAIALLIAIRPARVAAPVKDGKGPLAIQIDSRLVAPEYHSPMGWWRTHHMDAVNGGDFAEVDCLYCHEAATSCNNCHAYVGVKQIGAATPAVSGSAQ